MKYSMLALLLSLLCAVQADALELLTNGDFEEPLSPAWDQTITGTTASITRAQHYDPDADYEVYLYKWTGDGEARLSQTIAVPGLDVEFTANANLFATATSSAWSGAALLIAYLDEGDAVLGETCICARSYYCPWTNSSTFHIIEAVPSQWTIYNVKIDEELENLPGIEASRIRQLCVTLQVYADDC
jgi:hypothetical protein